MRFRAPDYEESALLAYCELEIAIPELGMFACHSMKLIRSPGGAIRLVFPASIVSRPCCVCRVAIPTGSRYCPRCGVKQTPMDIAVRRDEFHPVNGPTRDAVTAFVVQEFHKAGFDGGR